MKRIFLFVVALGVASTPAGAEILQSNAQRLFQSPSGQWYFECTIERRGVDVNGSFSTTLILDSPDGALQFDSVLSKENRFDGQSSPGSYEYAASLKRSVLKLWLLYTVQLIPEPGNPSGILARWACTVGLRDEVGTPNLGDSFQESLLFPATNP
jgi:hypothetical protein